MFFPASDTMQHVTFCLWSRNENMVTPLSFMTCVKQYGNCSDSPTDSNQLKSLFVMTPRHTHIKPYAPWRQGDSIYLLHKLILFPISQKMSTADWIMIRAHSWYKTFISKKINKTWYSYHSGHRIQSSWPYFYDEMWVRKLKLQSGFPQSSEKLRSSLTLKMI